VPGHRTLLIVLLLLPQPLVLFASEVHLHLPLLAQLAKNLRLLRLLLVHGGDVVLHVRQHLGALSLLLQLLRTPARVELRHLLVQLLFEVCLLCLACLLLARLGVEACLDHELIHHCPLVLRPTFIGGDAFEGIRRDPRNLLVGLLPHPSFDRVQILLRHLGHIHKRVDLAIDGTLRLRISNPRVVFREQLADESSS
jgi:hypothetical protein